MEKKTEQAKNQQNTKSLITLQDLLILKNSNISSKNQKNDFQFSDELVCVEEFILGD
jgi:hypothetical protein